jgi:hypothetical protein
MTQVVASIAHSAVLLAEHPPSRRHVIMNVDT